MVGMETLPLIKDFVVLEGRREGQGTGEGSLEYRVSTARCISHDTRGKVGEPKPLDKMLSALPNLYSFAESTLEVGARRFIPITLTNESAQRWRAYSLVVQVAKGQIVVLVAVSKLDHCLSSMHNLLESIVQIAPESPMGLARLLHWLLNAAPRPLPGLGYTLDIACLHNRQETRRVSLCFASPSPGNMLPSACDPDGYTFIQVMSVAGLLRLVTAVILERRVLLVTRKVGPDAASYLTVCAETLLMLVRPLKWQGIFVPFVPQSMALLVEAPTPYILGVNARELGRDDLELDPDVVVVNVDNGRLSCAAGPTPSVPPEMESRLDDIDCSSCCIWGALGHEGGGGDVAERGRTSVRDFVHQVRVCFGKIIVDVLEATMRRQEARTGPRPTARGAMPTAQPSAAATPLPSTPDPPSSPPHQLRTPAFPSPGLKSAQSIPTKGRRQRGHRRWYSWDDGEEIRSPTFSLADMSEAGRLEHTPSRRLGGAGAGGLHPSSPHGLQGTRGEAHGGILFDEFAETQVFQDFVSSGWPRNWPECVCWTREEMSARHSASEPSCFKFSVRADMDGDAPVLEIESGSGLLKSALLGAFSIATGLDEGCKADVLVMSQEGVWVEVLSAAGDRSARPFDFPETRTGEPAAIFGLYLERVGRHLADCSTLPYPPLNGKGPDALGTPASPTRAGQAARNELLHLDYFEHALDTGVEAYSIIPVGRIHAELARLGGDARDIVASRLGPNLSMLLETVVGARAGRRAVGEGGRPEVLNAPAAGANGAGSGAKSQRRADEVMLVCISTAKMLLTIQANKRARPFVDAEDIEAVANSPEYGYFCAATSELRHADLSSLAGKQREVFFINLYNLMVLHGALESARSKPGGGHWQPQASFLGWLNFLRHARYEVGGNAFSALEVEHAILRGGRQVLNGHVMLGGALLPRLEGGDPRLALRPPQPIPLLTFALCPGTACSPPLKCYHEHDLDNEIRSSSRFFLTKYCVCRKVHGPSTVGEGDGQARQAEVLQVHLPMLLKWYKHDLSCTATPSGKPGEGFLCRSVDKSEWLLSLASLMKGSSQSLAILQAIEEGKRISVQFHSYKWALGWTLQES